MNPGMEFVLFIILITTVGGILKARYGHSRDRDRLDDDGNSRRSRRTLMSDPEESAETRRLNEEVRALKERLHVLERITVEKESSLNREIDRLRDR
jgi:uncharacterized protein YlxW (UPF0749 family)